MEKHEVHVEGKLRIITKVITNTGTTFKAYYYNHYILITPTGNYLLAVVTSPQGEEIGRWKNYKHNEKDVAIKSCISHILDNYKNI
jgi:hypothetical protein